jgi:hypothetical protein
MLRIHRLRKVEPNAEERRRIEALLGTYTQYVRDQFQLFLNSVKHPETLATVEQALREGRVNDALAIVDGYVVRFGDAVVAAVPGIGQREAEALASQASVAGTGVALSFDPTAPEIVDALRRNRLQFVADFTLDQRITVAQALAEAGEKGLGPEAAARMFRDSIGLTPYQQGMVDRYRGLLEDNNARALELVLRDRRYDPGLERAIDADEVLPGARIDTMVDRYRQRLLQLRSETIARTEAGRIAELTRFNAMGQVAERAGIGRDLIVKVWQSTNDPRRRETHEGLEGQARLLDDPFDSESGATLMYPHDNDAPASEVINCRCTVAYQVFSTAAEAIAFLVANGQGLYDDLA